MISKAGCGHCVRAKNLLKQNNLSFEEIDLSENGLSNISLQAISGAATTPQIFVDGTLIGGADELEKWIQG
jgi:glutaredoxin